MGDILLVEDHAVYREPIKAILEHAGHTVRAVPNGLAALGALTERMPDLIMLDLAMPGMDGQEVLAHIRGFLSATALPVIVVTGKADAQSVTAIARLGVRAYLSKRDFSLDRLLALVTSALEPAGQGLHIDDAVSGYSAAGSSRVNVAGSIRGMVADDARGQSPTALPVADDYREALRSISPVMSGREAANQISAAFELEGFSPAIQEILTLTDSPGCTIDAVARAVSQDPAMSLRVIKLANSAAYSRGMAVESVRRAIVQIGINRIRQTVQTLGIVEQFAGRAFEGHLDTAEFWEHSVACAIIAAEIARATDPASAEAAFTAGLLHDIGRLILAKQLGPLYVQVIETAQRLHLPLEMVESRMLSVNHASVMEEIARRWRLPDELALPITLHHAPMGALRAYGPRQRAGIMRVAAANRLAHALLIGSSGNDMISPTVDLCRALELDVATMTRIETETHCQTLEMKAVMFGWADTPNRQPPVKRYQRLLERSFYPLFIGDDQAFDGCRMACSALTAKTKGPFTVAVVSVSDDSHHSVIAERLLAAERLARVSPLPVLLFSATGGVGGDLSMLGNRQAAILRMPVTALAFVHAVNRTALADLQAHESAR